ncbi:MAG: M48 family peptidase, partial [Methylophilaceae bacterium]|nr:M48 family peptidase [Methylophilaceae bacterium]
MSIRLNALFALILLSATVSFAGGTISSKPYNEPLDTRLPADLHQDLPELGDVSQTVLSAVDEQRIAEQILAEVSVSDEVLADVEVVDYLQSLGNRLAAASDDKQQEFYFFVVKDASINAFAMPGGVIGVHTGLF